MILTTKQHGKHLFADQNTQQSSYPNLKICKTSEKFVGLLISKLKPKTFVVN